MEDIYTAGLRVHSSLGLTTADHAFSFYDDQGNGYVPVAGDRIIVDEMVITQGSSAAVITIYFDYTAAGSYSASTGEEVFLGTLIANSTIVYPNCASRASNRIATQAPALRGKLSGSSTNMMVQVNARIVRS